MPTELFVNTHAKGPTLRLNFTISSKQVCAPINSAIFHVDHRAEVMLTISHKVKQGQHYHNLCLSAKMKVDRDRDTPPIQLRITRCNSGFSQQWVRPGPTMNGLDLGDIGSVPMNDAFVSMAELCISVFNFTTTSTRHIKFYEDTDLTDFHLSTEEGSVAVHRAFLAAHSEVFKAMLSSNWKETSVGRIAIKRVTLKTLKQLKDYLYLGTLPKDDLRPLLLLAAQYCIEDLKAECITKLATTAMSQNIYTLIDFACDYKIPELCLAIAQLTADEVIHQTYVNKDVEKNILGTKQNMLVRHTF